MSRWRDTARPLATSGCTLCIVCPRTVTLRGDAVAQGRCAMAAVIGDDEVSQRKNAGELCTRVSELTSDFGTSTVGGNTTTCGGCGFRFVGSVTGSALCGRQATEPAGDECPDSRAADGTFFGSMSSTRLSMKGQATPMLGDPLGRVPEEIGGDMVPEVGCLRCRNFLPQGEGGSECTGD